MNDILSGNVRALRKHLGLNQTDFGELVGSAQANVSKWERGTTPETEPLEAMARLAHCSIAEFKNRAWEPRAPVSDHLPTTNADAGEVVEITQLDLSLSMGPGTIIDDWVESSSVTFDLSFIRNITRSPPGRLRLVTGIGRSMEPTLQDGDAILVDTTDRSLARQDGVYWISIYGAAGIKRLRAIGPNVVLIRSDNPTVGDQEAPAEDIRIEGRAIWAARGL